MQAEWNKYTETQKERNRGEDEADRSERRSRDSRGEDRDREDIRKANLISKERIRIASGGRFEGKQRREERDRRDRR